MIPSGEQAYLRIRGILKMLSVALVVLVADQATKLFILLELGPTGDRVMIPVIPGVFRLLYVQNTGAAFGIFQGNSLALALLAVLVVLFLLFYFRRWIAESSRLALAIGLQLGGAIGNILDRLQHGFVIDFIDFRYWPTFNVADSAITIGVIILAVALFKREQRRNAERKNDVEVVDQRPVT